MSQRMGCIAGHFAVVIVIAAAAVPSASAQAADVRVRNDSMRFAPHRLIADRTSVNALRSFARRGAKGWIVLHRADGEVVYIKIDQIVFVTSAKETGATERARSKIQLLNGYSDVRESVEEVMQALESDVPTENDGT
jgi:hypothetical protein